MKRICWIVAIVVIGFQAVFAGDPPAPINFNLVQVNNYNHAPLPDSTVAPQRVVIDVQNPGAFRTMSPLANSGTVPQPTKVVNVAASFDPLDRGIALPWESSIMLKTESGSDSFLVTSSRTGCPGTEVRPSVSVAFSTPRGWSNPPIRFGPLTNKTVCPLGRGVELHVCAVGTAAPFVKIQDSGVTYSKR